MKRQSGHICAERNFRGRRIQEVCKRDPRFEQRRVSFGTAGKRPVCVSVMVIQIFDHRLGNDPRYLRSPRPVEISHTMAAMDTFQRWKVSADLIRRCNRYASLDRAMRHVNSLGITALPGA